MKQVGPFKIKNEIYLYQQQLVSLDYKKVVSDYEFLVHRLNSGEFKQLPEGTHAFFVFDGHNHLAHGVIEFTRMVYMTTPGNYSYEPVASGGG